MQKELNTLTALKVLAPAAAWLLTAALLTAIGSVLMSLTAGGESMLAYLSAAISFMAALAAALIAMKSSNKKGMLAAITCSAIICVVLLSFGFVIGEQGISPDGILSVVMFTIAGGLLGGFLGGGNKKKGNTRKKYRRKKS